MRICALDDGCEFKLQWNWSPKSQRLIKLTSSTVMSYACWLTQCSSSVFPFYVGEKKQYDMQKTVSRHEACLYWTPTIHCVTHRVAGLLESDHRHRWVPRAVQWCALRWRIAWDWSHWRGRRRGPSCPPRRRRGCPHWLAPRAEPWPRIHSETQGLGTRTWAGCLGWCVMGLWRWSPDAEHHSNNTASSWSVQH